MAARPAVPQKPKRKLWPFAAAMIVLLLCLAAEGVLLFRDKPDESLSAYETGSDSAELSVPSSSPSASSAPAISPPGTEAVRSEAPASSAPVSEAPISEAPAQETPAAAPAAEEPTETPAAETPAPASPKSEDDLQAALTAQTSDQIKSWLYGDYDGDSTMEAFAVTVTGSGYAIWFVSSDGTAEHLMDGLSTGWWLSETPINTGDHKYFEWTQSPSGTLYHNEFYLFGVKDGAAYQPAISGQSGIFGTDAQQEYAQAAVNEDAYYIAQWTNAADGTGSKWGNTVLYNYDLNTMEFVIR